MKLFLGAPWNIWLVRLCMVGELLTTGIEEFWWPTLKNIWVISYSIKTGNSSSPKLLNLIMSSRPKILWRLSWTLLTIFLWSTHLWSSVLIPMQKLLTSVTQLNWTGKICFWCNLLHLLLKEGSTEKNWSNLQLMIFFQNYQKHFGIFQCSELSALILLPRPLCFSKSLKDSISLLKEWEKPSSTWKEHWKDRSVWAWTSINLHLPLKTVIFPLVGLSWHLKQKRNLVDGWPTSATESNNTINGPKFRSLLLCGFLVFISLKHIWLP